MTRANIGKLYYTEMGALTREGLSNLVLSVFTQVLILWLRRSADLTVLTAYVSSDCSGLIVPYVIKKFQ